MLLLKVPRNIYYVVPALILYLACCHGGVLEPASADTSVSDFVTTWRVTTADEQTTTPTGGSAGTCALDWGGGHMSLPISGDQTHRYVISGGCQVYISGDFTRMFGNAHSFNQPPDSCDVSQATNMAGMFNYTAYFDQNHDGWYGAVDNSDICWVDVSNMGGTTSAQISFLDGQNPTYRIEPGVNPYLFTTTESNRISMVSAAADRMAYTSTITSAVDSVFEDGNNLRTTEAALADYPHYATSSTGPTNLVISEPIQISVAFDSSGGFGSLGWANDVAVYGSGNRAHSTVTGHSDDGVQIMDITDPARPASAAFDDSAEFTALSGAEDVEVFWVGNRTYAIVVASFDYSAVQIMDITDPARPVPVSAVTDGSGGFTILYGARDVAVFGNGGLTYAIVAVRNNDDSLVQIINITDPARPTPVSTVFANSEGFTTLRSPEDVEVFGFGDRTYAIVTSWGTTSVQIMDITDPALPTPVSATFVRKDAFSGLPSLSDTEVFVVGGRTYAIVVASFGNGGVQIINITDPARPIPVLTLFDDQGGFNALAWAKNVEVFGIGDRTYAIVTAHNDNGVQIMDITDPANPAPVSAVFDGSGGFGALYEANDVAVFGIGDRTYAIVTAYYGNSVQIMDITDPANPAPVSAVFDSTDDAESEFVQRLTDAILVALNGTNLAGEVFGVGDRTYTTATALYDKAMQIMDITDPANPAPISMVLDGSGKLGALALPLDLEVFGIGNHTYAIVAASDGSSVQIIDITDPARPMPISVVLDMSGEISEMAKEIDMEVFDSGGHTYAIVATFHGGGVRIIDVTDPANPVPISMVLDGPEDLGKMSVRLDVKVFGAGDRTYAIVTAWPDGGVHIIDVTDPANPVPISMVLDDSELTSPLSAPFDVGVFWSGDNTYAITASATRIDIADVTDPANPVPVQQETGDGLLESYALLVPYHMDLFEIGDRTYAMMTTVVGGVHIIIDVTDPANPTLIWPIDGASDELGSGFIPLFADVFRSGDRTYAITSFSFADTRIVDITDPSNPIHVPMTLDLVR